MSRLLTLMMIFVLVITHGSSLAAAVCRHESGGAHLAAIQSSDGRIAAVAYGEEAAGKMASKKAAPADSGSVSLPSDMLPAPQLRVPFRASEPVERNPADGPVLAGASVPPLLEPPAA